MAAQRCTNSRCCFLASNATIVSAVRADPKPNNVGPIHVSQSPIALNDFMPRGTRPAGSFAAAVFLESLLGKRAESITITLEAALPGFLVIQSLENLRSDRVLLLTRKSFDPPQCCFELAH